MGQADADNTWASIQDNGSHIISFNINLYNPDQRSVTLAEVCDGMREDLKAYPLSLIHIYQSGAFRFLSQC